MKKTKVILIFMYALLGAVLIGYNVLAIGQPQNIENIAQKSLKGDEVSSTNYLLKYKPIEGLAVPLHVANLAEIVIVNDETGENSVADIIPKDEMSIEEFFAIQDEIILSVEPDNTTEDTIDIANNKITFKTHTFLEQGETLYTNIAVIENMDRPDEFIGIVGNLKGDVNQEMFFEFIKSIEYTGQTLEEDRYFSDERNPLEVIIPANWKRVYRNGEYVFFKYTENTEAEIGIHVIEDEEFDVESYFSSIDAILQSSLPDTQVFDELINEYDGKTINTKIYVNEAEGIQYYAYFTLIEFKDRDEIVEINSSIVAKDGIDSIMGEIERIVDSIKFKE